MPKPTLKFFCVNFHLCSALWNEGQLTVGQQYDQYHGYARERRARQVQQMCRPTQLFAMLGASSRIQHSPLAPGRSSVARPFSHLAHVQQDGLALLCDAQHIVDYGLVDNAMAHDGGPVRRGSSVPRILHSNENGSAFAASELVGSLLVVQTRDQEQAVEPGGTAAESGALGNGREICEDQKAGSGESEARDGMGRPAGDQRGWFEVRCAGTRRGDGGHDMFGTWKPRQED